MTQTTVLPDQVDESASGIESPASTHAASRDDLGAALLRLNDAEVPESARQTLNETPETTDTDAGNAADLSVNPDDKADSDDAPGSRRGAGTQRTIAELRAEVEALKARVEAPQPVQTEPVDDPVAKAQEKLSALRGTDEDWQDLKTRVVDGLSFEDAERYRRMQVARDFEDEYQALGSAKANAEFSEYQSGFFTRVAAQFERVSGKSGVDPEFVKGNPDMGAVFDHIYEAGRKDLADENEQLLAEIKQLKATGLTTAPRLPNGGRTTLGLTSRPDPKDASPPDLLEAGMRQRSRAGR